MSCDTSENVCPYIQNLIVFNSNVIMCLTSHLNDNFQYQSVVVFCRPLYVFLVIILSVPLFGHYIVCLSLNFSFRLPLGYLQTHEEKSHMIVMCFNACRYFHVLIFLISCSKYRIWHLTNINKLTETENYRSSVRSNTLWHCCWKQLNFECMDRHLCIWNLHIFRLFVHCFKWELQEKDDWCH
jgi:hypothetical protein